MGFRINTNIGAMNAHRNATMNNVGLDKSLNALSSGLRINKAADDASGLAIANQLSAQSSGLGQAIRNANDAIGLIQTADGALEETGNILKRVRTLSVQSANDTQTAASRANITAEVTALIESLDNIASTTQFNGQNLLDATGGDGAGSFVFHTGAYSGETTTVAITSASSGTLAVDALDVSTQAAAETSITSVDAALVAVDTLRGTLGAGQNKLESTVRNISVTQVNVAAAESNIRDVDFAAESATFAKHNILAQSGTYAMSQANAVQQNVMRLLQ